SDIFWSAIGVIRKSALRRDVRSNCIFATIGSSKSRQKASSDFPVSLWTLVNLWSPRCLIRMVRERAFCSGYATALIDCYWYFDDFSSAYSHEISSKKQDITMEFLMDV